MRRALTGAVGWDNFATAVEHRVCIRLAQQSASLRLVRIWNGKRQTTFAGVEATFSVETFSDVHCSHQCTGGSFCQVVPVLPDDTVGQVDINPKELERS